MKDIELDLFRDIFLTKRTLSTLAYNGDAFGFVCEDPDRGLDETWTLEQIRARKIPGDTCIAVGLHPIVLQDSPKYGPNTLTIMTPGHQLIRVHSGNNEGHTRGCICPGMARTNAGTTRSAVAVSWLEARLVPHIKAGGAAWLRVHRDPTAWAKAPFNPEGK